MRILLMNCAFDARLTTAADLLNDYATLTDWSRALLAAGASGVSVLQSFRSDARLVRDGVEYLFCRDSAAGWSRSLHGLIAKQQPDIIHFNGLIFPWQMWRLRRALPARAAIVAQDHGGAEPGRRPVRWMKQRIGLRTADAFLFSAPEIAKPWQAARLIAPWQPVYAVMESSTTVRPLPRDAARLSSGVTGSPALLWVGRLNANKDPLTVLDGFERSLSALPAATVTMIYTSEDMLPAVRERIARSAVLKERVRLVGTVPHARLPAFYSAADLFVLGSHHEGSGYALMEACACGAVPVVTDIPTFRLITG